MALHNTEMGIVFDSTEYATKIYQQAKDKLTSQAYHVVLNNEQSLEWQDVTAEGKQIVFRHEPGTRWGERTLMYLLSWLPVEWLL